MWIYYIVVDNDIKSIEPLLLSLIRKNPTTIPVLAYIERGQVHEEDLLTKQSDAEISKNLEENVRYYLHEIITKHALESTAGDWTGEKSKVKCFTCSDIATFTQFKDGFQWLESSI